MASEYVINVKAVIDASGTTTSSNPNPTNPTAPSGEKNNATNALNKTANSMAILGGINHAAGQVQKFASLSNDTQVQEATKNISKLLRYGMKGARAITGDPIAICDLLADVVFDGLKQLKEVQTKQAAILNEQDQARINAGLLNIEDTTLKINSFNGRYSFKGRK